MCPPASDAKPDNAVMPSEHTSALLQSLTDSFSHALSKSMCLVAASAYAVSQHRRNSTSHAHHASQNPFEMKSHVGNGPNGGNICTCASEHHHEKQQLQPALKDTSPHASYATVIDLEEHEGNEESHVPCQNQQALRKQMQNLDEKGKMNLVRDRLMGPYKRSKTLELENNILRLFEDQYKRMDRTGAIVQPPPPNPEPTGDDMLGCQHYARKCKLKAKCCGLFVSCRFCHDEAMCEDHEMDRYATEEVLCMLCLKEQPVGEECVQCGVQFAHHFCSVCRFYENTPGKQVYHCHRCNICRRGKGLDIDNFHCDKCDSCVALDSKDHHKCMSNALHSNCPICHGYLFTSTEPVVFMRCGHTMHSKCFDEYTATSYQCPLCMRSLTNMEEYFRKLDALVEREPMPEEYRNKRSLIFCNDCEQKSVVPFHFMHHKCTNDNCNSYNTRVLNTFDVDKHACVQSSPSSASQQRLVADHRSSIDDSDGDGNHDHHDHDHNNHHHHDGDDAHVHLHHLSSTSINNTTNDNSGTNNGNRRDIEQCDANNESERRPDNGRFTESSMFGTRVRAFARRVGVAAVHEAEDHPASNGEFGRPPLESTV